MRRQTGCNHINDSSVVILDTRSAAEYNGTDIRTLRGGHIPGAINIDVMKNFDNQKNLLPADKLAVLYGPLDKTKDIVTYCHSGNRATITYFALRLLGYPKVRVYDDSMIVWGNNVQLPMESETWLDINAVNALQKDVSTLKATVNTLNAKVDQLQATADTLKAGMPSSWVLYGAYLVGIIGIILAIWAGTRKQKT